MAAVTTKMLQWKSTVKNHSYTLKPHTNTHTVRGRPTLKDVERFRNGSDRELCERTLNRVESETSIVTIVNKAYKLSSDIYDNTHIHKHHQAARRDREPSRIPLRAMKRLKNKSRKVRQLVYDRIRSMVPKSSRLHWHVKGMRSMEPDNKAMFLLKHLKGRDCRKVKLQRRVRQYLSMFSCDKPMSLYKTY